MLHAILRIRDIRLSPTALLFVLLIVVIWIAGGASRANAAGQIYVRAAALLALVLAALVAPRPVVDDSRSILVLLTLIAAVPLLQLVPLPPSIWQALPGRSLVHEGDMIAGGGAVWRPLTLSPADTVNAAFSLLVPAAVFCLLAGCRREERAWLPGLIVALVLATALAGLMQFSGTRFDQPLINYNGDVSGTFANRNHFALFVALGCLGLPGWALARRQGRQWRGPVAVGLGLLFLLLSLASGSRAGMIAVALALLLGALLVRRELTELARGRPRWVAPLAAAAALAITGGAIALSITTQRATSVHRLMTTETETDMRLRGLGTVLQMTAAHFPAGTGIGSFDAVFRVHEPFALLKPSYFNHAHDDWLEVVLDGGLAGVMVLAGALWWWAAATQRVWRRSAVGSYREGRLASAMLGLILLASFVDYPARTPLFMAVITMSAMLLAWADADQRAPASPK